MSDFAKGRPRFDGVAAMRAPPARPAEAHGRGRSGARSAELIGISGQRVLLGAAKRLTELAAAFVSCGMGPSALTALELAGVLPSFALLAGRQQALAGVAGQSP